MVVCVLEHWTYKATSDSDVNWGMLVKVTLDMELNVALLFGAIMAL